MSEESRHVRPILWRRIALEAGVIVTSILLALGAEAWRLERHDRSEEQIILQALREEFLANGASLKAQADSISAATLLLEHLVSMPREAFLAEVAAEEAGEIASAVQRPWTVEFRVGALDGTLGTGRSSLIQSHVLTSELVQYQAVRRELDEIGGLLGRVSVDSFVSFGELPESYPHLRALLKAKTGYWVAYRSYLDRFIAQTEAVAARIEGQLK